MSCGQVCLELTKPVNETSLTSYSLTLSGCTDKQARLKNLLT